MATRVEVSVGGVLVPPGGVSVVPLDEGTAVHSV
jgi:hypothetical protein